MTREQRIHLENIERNQLYTLRDTKIRVLKHQEQEFIERQNRVPLLLAISLVYLAYLAVGYMI